MSSALIIHRCNDQMRQRRFLSCRLDLALDAVSTSGCPEIAVLCSLALASNPVLNFFVDLTFHDYHIGIYLHHFVELSVLGEPLKVSFLALKTIKDTLVNEL
jgi:hypothetical protein